jgi:type II secretory pathway pseudopilin PulG
MPDATTSPAAGGNRGFRFVHFLLLASAAVLIATAAVLAPSVGVKMAEARDARRLEDLRTLQQAVQSYVRDHGELPAGDEEQGHGGWDTSIDGSLLSSLVEGGYLPEVLVDPINDELHHYRYFRYESGYEGFEGPFYVLGIRSFESDRYARQRGSWSGETRDWASEFAYVLGGSAP